MSVKVMAHVWETSTQKANKLLTLLALADNANDDGWAWPSQTTLARKCRVGVRAIQKLLDALEADNEVIIYNRVDANNPEQHYKNVYHLAKYGNPAALPPEELRGKMRIRAQGVANSGTGGGSEQPDEGVANGDSRGVMNGDSLPPESPDEGVANHRSQEPSIQPSLNPQMEPSETTTSVVVVVADEDLNHWLATFHQLEHQLDRASFETHLRDAALQRVEREDACPVTFVVGVRDEFAQHLCQHRYYRLIHRVLSDVTGEPCDLRFEVLPATSATPALGEPVPLHDQLAQPVTPQSVSDLFEQFVGPVTAAHTRAIQHLESHYSLSDVSYAFEVMAGKQAQGLVDDPLSYTFGVLRKLVKA